MRIAETAPSWQWNSIATFLPASLAASLSLGAMGLGLRRGIKRNQESWHSFELLVGEDFVIRRIKDFPEREIHTDEVMRIRETATALFVETKSKDRTIGISHSLLNYRDAKERLARWKPPVVERPQGWTSPRRWAWLFPVVTLVLFAVFFFATTKWVIVAIGIPLLVILTASIRLVQRNVQVSARTSPS